MSIFKSKYLLAPQGLEENWGLQVQGDTIVAIGAADTLVPAPNEEVIDLGNRLLMPGFVNGHNHMYGFLSHGIPTEALVTEFSSFLEDFWWPYVEDRLDHKLVAATTAWACVEMIESGVTAFADILEGPHAIPHALEVEREIVAQSGLRGLLSFEACQRVSHENGLLGLDENQTFLRNHKGELVEGFMSTHTLFTCDEGFIKEAKARTDAEGGLMHMHLCESVFEPNWCQQHHGTTPVKLYDQYGIWDSNILASQVVQVSDEDLDILASHGVRIVSMPLSNCEVGGGVAPVTQMLERNMTVGLGTDGYINNFFEVMRGAFLIHKAHRQDPMAMGAETVYHMATDMGAKALGLDDCGALVSGNKADFIALDLNTPTPINRHNVYDQIILFRNPSDVSHVMVGGKWLKYEGALCTMDKVKALETLQTVCQEFWTKKG